MSLFGGMFETESQREAPVHVSVEKISQASKVQEEIAGLGSNLLSEHSLLSESKSEKGAWLLDLQSRVLDSGGAAFSIKEGGATIGFVVADAEGLITQFRSVEGKESAVLEHALGALKEKGFDRPSVRLSGQSERMRKILRAADFREEKSEDGKIVMRKE